MNKSIVTYFKESDKNNYFGDKENEACYLELSIEIKKQGSDLFFTGGKKSRKSKGFFHNAWSFNSDGNLESSGSLQADSIYIRSSILPFNNPSSLKLLNKIWINNLCDSKFATYELFEEISPETIHVENAKEWVSAINSIKGNMIVSKPQSDFGGRDVIIDTKDRVIQRMGEVEYPAIVQEFMDTSNGIPGLIDGIHDFRVLVLNGEIMYSYTRQPAKDGEYRANVALGGVMNIINNSEIPESALVLVNKVVKKIEEVGAVNYLIAIDMGFTMSGEPKLIELNSKPGFDINSKHKLVHKLDQALAKVLINM